MTRESALHGKFFLKLKVKRNKWCYYQYSSWIWFLTLISGNLAELKLVCYFKLTDGTGRKQSQLTWHSFTIKVCQLVFAVGFLFFCWWLVGFQLNTIYTGHDCIKCGYHMKMEDKFSGAICWNIMQSMILLPVTSLLREGSKVLQIWNPREPKLWGVILRKKCNLLMYKVWKEKPGGNQIITT